MLLVADPWHSAEVTGSNLDWTSHLATSKGERGASNDAAFDAASVADTTPLLPNLENSSTTTSSDRFGWR
jgi:hypothetical protein